MSKSKKKLSGRDAAVGTIAAGGLAQLSRNKNVNNLGELGIFLGLIVLASELIKGIIKWCIIKPCIFITKMLIKLFWWTCKIIYYYPVKFLYKLFKTKYDSKKTI